MPICPVLEGQRADKKTVHTLVALQCLRDPLPLRKESWLRDKLSIKIFFVILRLGQKSKRDLKIVFSELQSLIDGFILYPWSLTMVSSLRIQICNFKFSGSFSSSLTRSHVHIFCAEAVNGSLGGLWLLPKTLAGRGGVTRSCGKGRPMLAQWVLAIYSL